MGKNRHNFGSFHQSKAYPAGEPLTKTLIALQNCRNQENTQRFTFRIDEEQQKKAEKEVEKKRRNRIKRG